jgi:TonB family protein
MKRFGGVAGMFWLAVAASAQTPLPAVSWVDEVLPPGASRPHAIGRHNCLDQYPAAVKDKNIEGTTALSYRIGDDGSVTKVEIRKSSGDAALDKAAVTCVKSWQYTPAVLDEKPIAIAWRNDVKWVIAVSPPQSYVPPSAIPTPPAAIPPPPVNAITVQKPGSPPPSISSVVSIGRPHACMQDYPPDAIAEHAEGKVTVKFNITVDGVTANNQIAESSGYAALDDAALACTKNWRYKPAMQDGKLIEVPWKAQVLWLLR